MGSLGVGVVVGGVCLFVCCFLFACFSMLLANHVDRVV